MATLSRIAWAGDNWKWPELWLKCHWNVRRLQVARSQSQSLTVFKDIFTDANLQRNSSSSLVAYIATGQAAFFSDFWIRNSAKSLPSSPSNIVGRIIEIQLQSQCSLCKAFHFFDLLGPSLLLDPNCDFAKHFAQEKKQRPLECWSSKDFERSISASNISRRCTRTWHQSLGQIFWMWFFKCVVEISWRLRLDIKSGARSLRSFNHHSTRPKRPINTFPDRSHFDGTT